MIDKVVIPTILMIIVVAMLGMILLVPIGLSASRVCAEHGYPSTLLTWGKIYCTRIVEQTEYVCPVKEAQNNSCPFEKK